MMNDYVSDSISESLSEYLIGTEREQTIIK